MDMSDLSFPRSDMSFRRNGSLFRVTSTLGFAGFSLVARSFKKFKKTASNDRSD